MSTDLDPRTRVVLSWLREDLHEDAERVLLRALDEVDATPQRRSWWPAWRTGSMNRNLTLAAGAVAVLVIAVVGWQLLPKADAGPSTGGQPSAAASPAPTPAPTPAATPVPTATPAASPSPSGPLSMTRGALEPGTYVTRPSARDAVQWQVTVPDGWSSGGSWFLVPTSLGLPDGPDGVAAAFLVNPAVFIDDCDFAGGTTTTSTVAELVAAIKAKDGWTVSNAEDASVGGFSGQRLDVQLPADEARCGVGTSAMVFGEPGTENGFFQQGPSQQLRVWILDANGTLVGLVRESYEGSPADRVAEAESILESSVITP